MGCSQWASKELDKTEQLSTHRDKHSTYPTPTHTQFEGRNRISAEDAMKHPFFLSLGGLGVTFFAYPLLWGPWGRADGVLVLVLLLHTPPKLSPQAGGERGERGRQRKTRASAKKVEGQG